MSRDCVISAAHWVLTVLPLARVQGGRTLSEKELKAAMAEMDRDSETSPV